MKTSLVNIEKAELGYIGTIVDFRYGKQNLLNHCYKTKDGQIKVVDIESQAPNFFTIAEFVLAYKNRKLQIL